MKKVFFLFIVCALVCGFTGCPDDIIDLVYNLVYNANGGTIGTVPETKQYSEGTEVTVAAKGTLGKTDYVFTTWNTQADGNGTSHAPLSKLTMPAGDVTLYAQWRLADSYTVTYDANGANGTPPEAQQHKEAVQFAVPDEGELALAGYMFIGWCADKNGDGTLYKHNDLYTMPSANLTLYAIWELVPVTYTVRYWGNGHTGGTVPANEEYEEGEEFSVPPRGDLVKLNHAFHGWCESPEGEGAQYEYPEKYTMGDADVDFYAVWERTALDKYYVYYHANANDTTGSPPPDLEHLGEDNDDEYVVPGPNTLKRNGYAFIGWCVKPEGSELGFECWGEGEEFYLDSQDYHVYAQWVPIRTAGQVSCGNAHAMIVMMNGDLLAMGYNSVGQLGDGTTTTRYLPVKVMEGVKKVACGGNTTFILKFDGTLYATGRNSNGQFGNGTTDNSLTPILIRTGVHDMSVGIDHALVIDYDVVDYPVYVAGSNSWGQLGFESVYSDVTTWTHLTDDVRSVSAGDRYSLISKWDGTAFSFGNNMEGEGGTGTLTVPSDYHPQQVVGLTDVIEVEAGWTHSLFMTGDGDLYVCGNGGWGALGLGANPNPGNPWYVTTPVKLAAFDDRVLGMAAGPIYSVFIADETEGNNVWGMGYNSDYPLGIDNLSAEEGMVPNFLQNTARSVAAGDTFTMIIKDDGSVYAAGRDENGRKGTGTDFLFSEHLWERVPVEKAYP